jgi:bifunctional DNA-binding transcriptional regulator/antitoxin component of YhaV-PrlF toxin-antitoxin module
LSLVVVDDRGRIVIPSRIRRMLGLKRLAREIAEEIAGSGLDLEELGRKVEEANKPAKEKIHD